MAGIGVYNLFCLLVIEIVFIDIGTADIIQIDGTLDIVVICRRQISASDNQIIESDIVFRAIETDGSMGQQIVILYSGDILPFDPQTVIHIALDY